MIRKFREEMALALKGTAHWKSMAFMAFCCEPMLANYRLYQHEYKRGNFLALREALNVLWDSALVESPTPY